MASRVFFPRTPTKTDEQASSYFTVNRSFRAKLLFSSMIWSAECFFHGLYDSLGNTKNLYKAKFRLFDTVLV